METQTRFDLSKAIAEWRGELAAQPGMDAEQVRELASHLADSVERFKSAGLDEAEAFWVAARRLGPCDKIAAEFGKTEPARIWRERVYWMAVGTLGFGACFSAMISGLLYWSIEDTGWFVWLSWSIIVLLSMIGAIRPIPFVFRRWLGRMDGLISRGVPFLYGVFLVISSIWTLTVLFKAHASPVENPEDFPLVLTIIWNLAPIVAMVALILFLNPPEPQEWQYLPFLRLRLNLPPTPEIGLRLRSNAQHSESHTVTTTRERFLRMFGGGSETVTELGVFFRDNLERLKCAGLVDDEVFGLVERRFKSRDQKNQEANLTKRGWASTLWRHRLYWMAVGGFAFEIYSSFASFFKAVLRAPILKYNYVQQEWCMVGITIIAYGLLARLAFSLRKGHVPSLILRSNYGLSRNLFRTLVGLIIIDAAINVLNWSFRDFNLAISGSWLTVQREFAVDDCAANMLILVLLVTFLPPKSSGAKLSIANG